MSNSYIEIFLKTTSGIYGISSVINYSERKSAISVLTEQSHTFTIELANSYKIIYFVFRPVISKKKINIDSLNSFK